VQLLLKKGADIEAKDKDEWTALHEAAQNGHEAVVQLLLKKGAHIEAKGQG
jgi:ankyrin repeat protein